LRIAAARPSSPNMNAIVRALQRVTAAHAQTVPDPVLLARFVTDRDEEAFTALVLRHAGLVYRVCRAALGHEQDAEDAVQATFLVLAQRAARIRRPASLACWLHGVALRTCRKARELAARREGIRVPPPDGGADPAGELSVREAGRILHEELARLPERYRAPLVLCYLEDKTHDEAAAALGWSLTAFRGRLDRARQVIRRRLERRGLCLGAVLSVPALGALDSRILAATLAVPTSRAAVVGIEQAATGGTVSPAVFRLTCGVLATMTTSSFKLTAAVLVGLVLVAGSAFGFAVLSGQPTPGAGVSRSPEPGLVNSQPALSRAEPEKKAAEVKLAWRESFVLKHDHPVNIVACSADWIAVGDEGGNLYLCAAKTGKDRTLRAKGGKKDDGLTTSVDWLQLTSDGKYLFAGTSERRAVTRFVLDPKSDEPSNGFSSGNLFWLGVSADGETVLEDHGGNRLGLRASPWSNEDAGLKTIEYKAEFLHTVFSPDSKRLAVVTADEQLHLHDRESLKETQTIALPKQKVRAVQFSPDGKRLVVVGDGSLAAVYDTENGKEVTTFKGHKGLVFCAAFSPDGKTVVTGGDDNVARVWDAVTGKSLAVLEGHKDAVRSTAFDPSGEVLVTGSADKTAKAWRRAK
jgi:RNA polymerase sigma factor (sigma-70 family)